MSEFLRKLANGYIPKEKPPIDYLTLVSILSELYVEMKIHYSPKTEQKILDTMLEMQREMVQPERRGDGDNKNMAGQG